MKWLFIILAFIGNLFYASTLIESPVDYEGAEALLAYGVYMSHVGALGLCIFALFAFSFIFLMGFKYLVCDNMGSWWAEHLRCMREDSMMKNPFVGRAIKSGIFFGLILLLLMALTLYLK